MFKPLIFASLLLPLAAQADIKTLQADEAANCKLIKEDVCKTTSKNPVKACDEWHQNKAKEQGADALLMGGSEHSTVRRPSLTGPKEVTTTKIRARYYQCGLEQQALQQAVKSVVNTAPSALTIEQRLIRLNSLKEKGLITQREYEQKRQQVLDEL